MTIHHDKLAYGKLASAREDIFDERLMEMLSALEAYENEDETIEKAAITDEGEDNTNEREGEQIACRKTKEKN